MPKDWIAYRLALLIADQRGRFRKSGGPWDRAVRVALLLDLVQLGRVSLLGNGSLVDTTPTGFLPADTLIAYVYEHPTGSMLDLFGSAPIGLAAMAVNQASRRFSRYDVGDVDPDEAAAEKDRVREVALGEPVDSEATAILAILADSLFLTVLNKDLELAAHCGGHAPLVVECANYLRAQAEQAAISAAMPGTVGGGG